MLIIFFKIFDRKLGITQCALVYMNLKLKVIFVSNFYYEKVVLGRTILIVISPLERHPVNVVNTMILKPKPFNEI